MINLGEPWSHSIDTIDWSGSNIDILLYDWFNVQLPDLHKLKQAVQKHPDVKIKIKSGTGPFMPIFKDCDHVVTEMSWQHFPGYWLYEHCQNKNNIPIYEQQFEHVVSTFNGTWHWSRMLMIIYLYQKGLWHDDYCSKSKLLTCKLDKLTQWQKNGLENIIGNMTTDKIKKFLLHHNEFDYNDRFDWQSNIKTLSPIMKKTFVNLVSETFAEGTEPFYSEKPFQAIMNKSLSLILAQPDYYKVLETCFGFKKFKCFDYSFDQEKNFLQRIILIIDQIHALSKKSVQEQKSIYDDNKDILDYNFNHFMSGEWTTQCEQTMHDLDNIISRTYNTKGEKIHGQTI